MRPFCLGLNVLNLAMDRNTAAMCQDTYHPADKATYFEQSSDIII